MLLNECLLYPIVQELSRLDFVVFLQQTVCNKLYTYYSQKNRVCLDPINKLFL